MPVFMYSWQNKTRLLFFCQVSTTLVFEENRYFILCVFLNLQLQEKDTFKEMGNEVHSDLHIKEFRFWPKSIFHPNLNPNTVYFQKLRAGAGLETHHTDFFITDIGPEGLL